MTEAATTELTAPTAGAADQPTATEPAAALVTDVLVEEVSIDGMCGVY